MMLWRMNWIGAVVLAVAFITMSGCGKGNESSSTATTQAGGGTAGAGGKALNLAFVTNNASDFWTIARAGCNKAQEEMPNVKVDFQIPSSGSAAEQKRIIDDLLTRGVDGIAISPVDPANETTRLNQV